MNDFQFTIPQNISFGTGSLTRLPQLIQEVNAKRVFIISDRGLESVGVVETVSNIITQANIRVDSYLDVLPNPTIEIVNEATQSYKDSGASAIIALGGGSPLDVAKAVGVLARHGGRVTDYEGANKVPGAIEPIIAIPTTAGTGSEVTPFSVITDEAHNHKLTIFSNEVLPAYALLDPELIMTAPSGVAAACGIDAMIHAWEAYTSRAANPFTDAMAEKALDLIGGNIRRFVANRQDQEAAEAMMAGSTFAGIAFAWARLGNVHAMSHPVSGFFHVAHGVANAILLPTIVEYNAIADRGQYRRIYRYIREVRHQPIVDFKPQVLVDEVRKLLRDLGMPTTLSEVGVTEDKIEAMADDAMTSGNIVLNPRTTTRDDVIALYRKAL
ncbi:MAG: iron-containing alcohol dehydrogenase [Atopobiaceae bacterium]|nr:iron-containing alcohol dehydrogenase [Atopobiaceae bacterium]